MFHSSASNQYNRHIDKHLIALIDMELNLKELFESEILYHKIENYTSQENNKSDLLFPVLKD